MAIIKLSGSAKLVRKSHTTMLSRNYGLYLASS